MTDTLELSHWIGGEKVAPLEMTAAPTLRLSLSHR